MNDWGAVSRPRSSRGSPRLADPDSALETIDGVESLWREDGDAGQYDVYHAVVATFLSNGSAQASMTRVRRIFLSSSEAGRRCGAGPYLGTPTGEAPRGAIYFNVTQFLVDGSWYMRWLTARPDIKPVYFVHDLIPFEAPEFFRAREAMLHSRRMNKIRRYGAGAVVGSQAVARRLRASAEETPPTPMLFLQRLTTSSRNYKARFDAEQN